MSGSLMDTVNIYDDSSEAATSHKAGSDDKLSSPFGGTTLVDSDSDSDSGTDVDSIGYNAGSVPDCDDANGYWPQLREVINEDFGAGELVGGGPAIQLRHEGSHGISLLEIVVRLERLSEAISGLMGPARVEDVQDAALPAFNMEVVGQFRDGIGNLLESRFNGDGEEGDMDGKLEDIMRRPG